MQYFLIKVKIPLKGDGTVDENVAKALGEGLKVQMAAIGAEVETSLVSDTPSASTEVPELETGNRAQ